MKRQISVGSVTYAQKAKHTLLSHGIRTRLIKLDTSIQEGCIYGIEVRETDYLRAISLLREAGIRFGGSP